jgi:hypothetical protein
MTKGSPIREPLASIPAAAFEVSPFTLYCKNLILRVNRQDSSDPLLPASRTGGRGSISVSLYGVVSLTLWCASFTLCVNPQLT